MKFSTCVRMLCGAAIVGSMAWAGATLMTSPADAAIADSTLAADVVATTSSEGASAVTTLVAESTVGATVVVNDNGGSVRNGGLRANGNNAGSARRSRVNTYAAALNAMPGGWWFRHSCFIP